jgi:hypothetical protein
MPIVSQQVAGALTSQRRYSYADPLHATSSSKKPKQQRREDDRKRNLLRSRRKAAPSGFRAKASDFALAGPLPELRSDAVSVAFLGLEVIAKQRTYEAASGLAKALASILAASSSENLGDVLRVVAREANEAYFADLVEAFGEVPLQSARGSLIIFLRDMTENPSPYLRQAARNALDLIESAA